MSEIDIVEIQNLYQTKLRGWNLGNDEIFSGVYTDDADFIGFDGTYLKGKQKIASFHQMLFDRFLKGSKIVGKIKCIRFLTADVAVVVAIGGTIESGRSKINPDRNSIHTMVAVKKDSRNSRWYFTAFQNTRAKYIGQPEKTEELTKEVEELEVIK